MAISTGTANVHILSESAQHVVARCLYFTNNGTDEADVLKVNTAALTFKTVNLATTTDTGVFLPGDTVTGTTSGVTAQIVAWRNTGLVSGGGTLTVSNATGNFTNNEAITALRTGASTSLGPNAQSLLPRRLAIRSIWYSIDVDMTVELGFRGNDVDGAAVIVPAVLLSGSGYFGKNALSGQITSNAAGIGVDADGSFYISTYTTSSAKAAYTVIVDLVKLNGYSPAGI